MEKITNLFKKSDSTPPAENFLAVQIQEGIVKTAVWQIDQGQASVVAYGSIQDWVDIDALVLAVDTSLAAALADLPLEPNRVIFGLPESWVQEDKIAPDFTTHLKAIIEQLKLKPIGFVVITEAVIQWLRNQEGIPPSIILLELNTSKVNVVVVKLGQVIGREEVDRSDDLAKDVEEALARMEIDQLPSRILILNDDDPDAEQQLLSYPWQEKLPFLHLPKVETPDPHFSVQAIALSGGSEAARSLGIEVTGGEEPTASTVEGTEDLGFVADQDIAEIGEEPALPPPTQPKFKLPNLRLPTFNFPALPQLRLNRSWLIIPPVVLLLLVGGGYLYYAAKANAQIILFVETKNLDKNLTLTLPSQTETIEIEKSGSIAATGEALVGEKATGKVVIYNKTDAEKVLKSGTVLVTANNLKYILNELTAIASQSAEPPFSAGSVQATVTASNIGASHNISSGTPLTISDYPGKQLEARAETDFSGGTSRTVKAVSQADRDKLLTTIQEQMKQEAKEKLELATRDFQYTSSDLDLIKQSFSKGVGEEAEELSLQLKGKVKFLKFQQNTLIELAKGQLQPELPPGFTFDLSTFSIETSDPQTQDSLTTLQAATKVKLIPDINISDYLDRIKGKSVSVANDLLENIAGYKRVQFLIQPKIPLLSSRLPGNVNRIQLEIRSGE